MSDPAPTPPREPTASPAESILAELEAALVEQLSLAGKDDLEGVLTASRGLEELLRRAEGVPRPMSRQCLDRLARVRDLHRRLAVTLAQRKQELAGQLRQLRQGKRTLRAYGDNA